MKITSTDNSFKVKAPKLASNQIDKVKDVNFNGSRANHRISFKYHKELERNVAHVIDNSTGETVKKALSDAQIDNMIRIKKLIGIHLDKKV